ncbi:MAG: hypothetical protein JG718_10955 [Candidatus Thiothrix moscowensis]|nr:hypothetical protein [Candidatus Thiothrix moscowensis]
MPATFDFILSIPVADRPAHLRHCLESIQQQRALHGYPGNITVVSPGRLPNTVSFARNPVILKFMENLRYMSCSMIYRTAAQANKRVMFEEFGEEFLVVLEL